MRATLKKSLKGRDARNALAVRPGFFVSGAQDMNKRRGPRTELIHGGIERSQFGETAEPIHMTSGFIYERAEQAEDRFRDRDQGFMYSRYGNPTVRTFEERMMALEGAEAACATGSGMAAVHAAIMCQMRSGMRVVAARLLFGSCRYILTDILTRFGVEITFVCTFDESACIWTPKDGIEVPGTLGPVSRRVVPPRPLVARRRPSCSTPCVRSAKESKVHAIARPNVFCASKVRSIEQPVK